MEERRRVAAVPILAYVAIAAAVSRTRRPIAEVRSPEDGAALLNGAKGRRAKIWTLSKSKRRTTVKQLVEEISPATEDEFSICITALSRVQCWKSALSLLRSSGIELGLPEGSDDRTQRCFSAVISACRKAGQWERALELLDELRAREDPPNA